MSGYKEALEAAGAEIIDFGEFGSYQGDWIALVNYNGNIGFVQGSYGSCGGCDAFEGEFGYINDENSQEYKDKLKTFGENYLDGILPYDKMLEYTSRNEEWDMDAKEMIIWVKKYEKLLHDKNFYDKLNIQLTEDN